MMIDDLYIGLEQNELVVSGQDLFFPFKVVGGADAINLYLDAWANAYYGNQQKRIKKKKKKCSLIAQTAQRTNSLTGDET